MKQWWLLKNEFKITGRTNIITELREKVRSDWSKIYIGYCLCKPIDSRKIFPALRNEAILEDIPDFNLSKAFALME